MKKVTRIWTEPNEAIIAECMKFGIPRLARETGISRSLIARWLHQKEGMTAPMVRRIQEVIFVRTVKREPAMV